MKQLVYYSAIILFGTSCASQKYSRTDNIIDDVYFSPSFAQKVTEADLEEPEQDGFHYETGSNTPNPNASYHRYQATGANTNYPTPDTNPQINYSNPSYSNITNNYYGNTYTNGYNGFNGYNNWGMAPAFGCQPGFGMIYSPYHGWGWGMSFSYYPYGFTPFGGCFNPWGSPFGYSPYYGYFPYYGYSPYYGYGYNPWYGYNPGYGYYNPYPVYNPGTISLGSGITHQPRPSRGTIFPANPSGTGTGRGRSPITTQPVKPVFRPGNEAQPNTNPPVLRGSEGAPAVTPTEGGPVQRTKPTPAKPETNPAVQPQDPQTRPAPTPAPQRPVVKPEDKPAPQPQQPQVQPEARPTPQPQRPQVRPEPRPAPQPQRPEARPTPQPRPQAPSPQPAPPSRQPNVNPSPSPSPSPSRPSGNGGTTPHRGR